MFSEEILKENGKYYGYPDCCIAYFLKIRFKHVAGKPLKREQEKVHKNHGFLPCPKHARLILKGKTTLQKLIKNRICLTPFPDDGLKNKLV